MSALRQLRWTAFLEGVSFLVLLFIAMPVKYLWEQPLAVRVTGSVHGLLFLLFVSSLFRAASEHGWPWKRSLAAFGASLVPFGTFVLDRALRRDEQRAAEDLNP
jgi:integral membrane protein